jgi:CRP/FNR family transcriptional regulator
MVRQEASDARVFNLGHLFFFLAIPMVLRSRATFFAVRLSRPMLSQETLSRLLSLYPIFDDLATSDQQNLLKAADVIRIPAGTVLFDENEPCGGFPLLIAGNIRVVKAASNGRELQLYRVVPGESCILTSSCLLGNTLYHARGIAEQVLEMVVLPPTSFHSVLAKSKMFRDYVFKLFSSRLTDLMELVSAVAFQKLDQRLASLLLNKQSPIHATHQSLADELGSAREMVSRLLKSFAEQGWVKLGREQIEIIDERALKHLASF